MIDEQMQRRLAANENVFREVNEGIRRGQWPGEPEALVSFRCECAQLGCNLLLALTLDEYRRVRADERRFMVAVGHEVPDVEFVVQRRRDHLVVEKVGAAGRLAGDLDSER